MTTGLSSANASCVRDRIQERVRQSLSLRPERQSGYALNHAKEIEEAGSGKTTPQSFFREIDHVRPLTRIPRKISSRCRAAFPAKRFGTLYSSRGRSRAPARRRTARSKTRAPTCEDDGGPPGPPYHSASSRLGRRKAVESAPLARPTLPTASVVSRERLVSRDWRECEDSGSSRRSVRGLPYGYFAGGQP